MARPLLHVIDMRPSFQLYATDLLSEIVRVEAQRERERLVRSLYRGLVGEVARRARWGIEPGAVHTIAGDLLLELLGDPRLVRVIHRLIRRAFGRWRRRAKVAYMALDDSTVGRHGAFVELVDLEKTSRIAECLISDQALIVLTRRVLGVSFAEIASDLGMAEVTARAVHRRAMARLRRFWEVEAAGALAHMDLLQPVDRELLRLVVQGRRLQEVVALTGLETSAVRARVGNLVQRISFQVSATEGQLARLRRPKARRR